MVNLEELMKQKESECLDFKRQFPQNNIELLHDIMCLANAYIDGDRYLVFGIDDNKTVGGVKNDSNRKNNANLQDIFRQSNFNRIPTIQIETLEYSPNIEVDILVIKNRPDKPFFLNKDKSYQGKTIRAGVIYTRLGDTNIPLTESAPEDHIELMWRERFGFGLPPLKRMKRLLDESKDWTKINDEKQIYHKVFPEFTIRRGERLNENFTEPWSEKFIDRHAYSYEVELRYFETIIRQEAFVSCDGGRYKIPLPESESSDLETKYYLQRDSFS